MMLGALVDSGVPLDAIRAGVRSLGLTNCDLVGHEVKRRGFRATKVDVQHEPEHVHRHLHHITEMIDRSDLTPSQKHLAKQIFQRLAEAEAKVHGTTVQRVHFHEVGAVDSIADIVGAAIGIDLLGADRIECSAIPTGSGTVKIAHGLVSVPAPATAELLKGVPLAPSTIKAELTTPTGAAIVSTVVDRFGPLPPMRIERIGYGAGSCDFEGQANLVRLLIGHSDDAVLQDQVWMLETNLDDQSGELIGHTLQLLMDGGALDAYTTAIQMKKGRPAVMLSVLCQAERADALTQILFRETTTLGVRCWPVTRQKLARQAVTVDTPWGPVQGKLALLNDRPRFSPEYEACRTVAIAHQVPLQEVYQAAHRAYHESGAEQR